uniref:TetR family transcriptional regulator n=1 Tax=Thermosporothrix sp. COM3 TaxID=2490863 RepID=A0A455SLL0_9CHLR|nr:TetR family transcriptional regulator [Thermosporothrix sp. COM3]
MDPRVKRTRKLLQQAFLELLQEKEFSSISVQDITERATINRATFYAHFTDKYMLLDITLRQLFQDAITSKLPASAQGDKYNLRQVIGIVLGFLNEFYSRCDPDNLYKVERIVQEEVEVILLRWLKQTAITDPGVRRETIATAMSWAICGTAIKWCLDKKGLSHSEMVQHILQVLMEMGTYVRNLA